jgi:hypothetical protein
MGKAEAAAAAISTLDINCNFIHKHGPSPANAKTKASLKTAKPSLLTLPVRKHRDLFMGGLALLSVMENFQRRSRSGFKNAYNPPVLASVTELNNSVDFGVKSVVFTQTHILSGFEFCTPLANQNASRTDLLPAESFYA